MIRYLSAWTCDLQVTVGVLATSWWKENVTVYVDWISCNKGLSRMQLWLPSTMCHSIHTTLHHFRESFYCRLLCHPKSNFCAKCPNSHFQRFSSGLRVAIHFQFNDKVLYNRNISKPNCCHCKIAHSDYLSLFLSNITNLHRGRH